MVILRHATELGNLTKKLPLKKTIAQFFNSKFCKTALINRRNLIKINNETTYNLSKNNKIFINENLTRTNESVAFCGTTLKQNGQIQSCYTTDGIVHKKKQTFKSTKVHHMNFLYDNFPEFEFL